MKLVESADATGTLAEYAAKIQSGPVVVTQQGRPIAVLVPIQNADLETVTLSMNPQFMDIIERSRARSRDEGGISSDEMRRRFQANMPADSVVTGGAYSATMSPGEKKVEVYWGKSATGATETDTASQGTVQMFEAIPPQYNYQTTLTYNLVEGEHVKDFELTTN
jgi:antitoxin (DNA-binding transcriptional repressor) of toxin-antitoxin stability system